MHKFIVLPPVTLFFLISGCGGGGSSGGVTETPTPTVTYSDAGPTDCVSASFTSGVVAAPSAEYSEKIKNILQTPLQFPVVSVATPTQEKIHLLDNQAKQEDKKRISQIVGGETASTSTQCLGSSTAAQTRVNKNTVAVYIPRPNSAFADLCTGSLVSDGTNLLVLTAAHCFNSLANLGDKTANGARVYFNDTLSGNLNDKYLNVTCWQRHKYYHSTQVSASDASTSLFDIGWVKLSSNTPLNSYSSAPLVATPSSVASTAEKVMAGFGKISDNDNLITNPPLKRCVSTYADPNYQTRGDIVLSAGVTYYNASAVEALGATIASTNAYQNYVTVIGPINTTPRGTCFGDSGGPVYAYRNGSWSIYALTQGSDNVISRQPAINFSAQTSPTGLDNASNFNTTLSNCSDGYGIYTTVGNHIRWISTTSGITPVSQ